MTTLLAPQTGAGTAQFNVRRGDTVTIGADLLAGAEEATLELSMGGAFVATGDVLTATIPSKAIGSPGRYQLSKPTTVGACGLYISGVWDDAPQDEF